MNESLLKELSAAQFAALEMNMYLDTHANDSKAFSLFKKYSRAANELRERYEREYGPLTVRDVYGSSSYDWIDSPWPWENEKGRK